VGGCSGALVWDAPVAFAGPQVHGGKEFGVQSFRLTQQEEAWCTALLGCG
jgi:hypothetical protein